MTIDFQRQTFLFLSPWALSLFHWELNLINKWLVWLYNGRWGHISLNTNHIGAIFCLLWCYVLFSKHFFYCLNERKLQVVIWHHRLPFNSVPECCHWHRGSWVYADPSQIMFYLWCLRATCRQIYLLPDAARPAYILFQQPMAMSHMSGSGKLPNGRWRCWLCIWLCHDVAFWARAVVCAADHLCHSKPTELRSGPAKLSNGFLRDIPKPF